MKQFKPIFFQRQTLGLTAPAPDVSFKVERYTAGIYGGPIAARIVAVGSEDALLDCANLLRCGVSIIDELADEVWWGYVDEVRIQMGAVEWGIAMSDMANSIWVAYTSTEGAGGMTARATTDKGMDALSVSEYGEKQLLATANNLDAASAVNMRDLALKQMGWPMPSADMTGSDGMQVVLMCKGWFDTFAWRYYSNSKGIFGYTATPDNYKSIGDHTDIHEILWALPSGTDTFDKLALYVYKSQYGFPSMNINGEIRQTDRNGAVLATFTITPADITNTRGGAGGLIEKTLSTPINASTAQMAIMLKNPSFPTGQDLTNHYRIGVTNIQAFPYANTNYYENPGGGGAAWWPLPFETIFKFTGKTTVTAQLVEMLTSAGQFFTGVELETTSNAKLNPYRAGDATALKQIQELLAIQESNNPRLAVEVTRDRRVRVYAEPPETTICYVDKYMNPYGSAGEPMPRHYCPYGMWVQLREKTPLVGSGGVNLTSTVGFVESAEYNVASDKWTPRLRKNKSALEAAGIKEG